MEHKVIPSEQRHGPFAWEVADASARTALAPTDADRGKVCWQKSDNTQWVWTDADAWAKLSHPTAVVNDDVTGGTTVAWSAERGKILSASAARVNEYGLIEGPTGELLDIPYINASGALVSGDGSGLGLEQRTRLVSAGDSTANQNAQATASNAVQNLGNAWLPLALAIARHPLDLVRVSGRSGWRTDQILATFAEDVAAYAPHWVTINMGTNDITQGVAASVALANYEAYVDRCLGIAATPVLFDLSAAEGFSGASQSIRDEWQKFNAGMRLMAVRRRLPFVSLEGAIIDPASATNAPLAGQTDGTVHPANKGSVRWAQATASQWLSRLPTRTLSVYSRGGANAAPNPLFGGSGGTGGAGVSGTIPAGCTVTPSGSPTVVSSVIARTDGPGNWWQLDCSFPTLSDTIGVKLGSALSLSGSQFAVGDIVRCVADIEIETATNMQTIDLRLRFLPNGGDPNINWTYAYAPATAAGSLPSPMPLSLQLRCPEIAIPTTKTSIEAYLQLNTAATSAACKVRIGALTIVKA